MNQPGPLNLTELLEHADWLRRLSAHLLQDKNDADDLVQDTWLVVAKNGPTTPGRERSWLGTVCRNLVRQGNRARLRRQKRESVAATSLREDTEPEALYLQAQAHRDVVNAVLSLPDLYRQVVLMRYFQDLSPKTIADRLNRPASTVRAQLSRGLQQIKDILELRDEDYRSMLAIALGPPLMKPSVVASAMALLSNVYIAASLLMTASLAGAIWWAVDDHDPPTWKTENGDGSITSTSEVRDNRAGINDNLSNADRVAQEDEPRPLTSVRSGIDTPHAKERTGWIRDPLNRGIEGARVVFMDQSQDLTFETDTNSKGRFSWNEGHDDVTNLYVEADGFASQPFSPWEHGEPKPTPWIVSLEVGTTFHGMLAFDGQKAIPGAQVRAYRYRSNVKPGRDDRLGPWNWVNTNAEGLFSLPGLPPSRLIQLELRDAGGLEFEDRCIITSPELSAATERTLVSVEEPATLEVFVHGGLDGTLVRITSPLAQSRGEKTRALLKNRTVVFAHLRRGDVLHIEAEREDGSRVSLAQSVRLDQVHNRIEVEWPRSRNVSLRRKAQDSWFLHYRLVDSDGKIIDTERLNRAGISTTELLAEQLQSDQRERLLIGIQPGSTRHQLQLTGKSASMLEFSLRGNILFKGDIEENQIIDVEIPLSDYESEGALVRFTGRNEKGETTRIGSLVLVELSTGLLRAFGVATARGDLVVRVSPGSHAGRVTSMDTAPSYFDLEVASNELQVVEIPIYGPRVLQGKIIVENAQGMSFLQLLHPGPMPMIQYEPGARWKIRPDLTFQAESLSPGSYVARLSTMNFIEQTLQVRSSSVEVSTEPLTKKDIVFEEPREWFEFTVEFGDVPHVYMLGLDSLDHLVVAMPLSQQTRVFLPEVPARFIAYPFSRNRHTSGFDENRPIIGAMSEPDERGKRTVRFE